MPTIKDLAISSSPVVHGPNLPFVVVVVLSWNKQQAVIDCLDRLTALTGVNMRVVVVDNASSDDSVEAIRNAHPHVTIVEESINRGFAGGVNAGLAEAERQRADYAWLLNDDTTFEDSTLATLLAQATASRSGLSTPLLRDLAEQGAGVQFANGIVDWSRGTMGHNFPEAVFVERVAAGATPIVPGTALLCDLGVYRSIGPFDERFFAYWEDTDYAARAARAGFAATVVAATTVWHAAPRTTERPAYYHYYMTRNEALFWRLHGDKVRWKRRWFAMALDAIGRERDLGHGDNVDAVIDGLWHAWTRRYGPRDMTAPAPRWLRRVLRRSPYLLSTLVQGRVRKTVGRLFHIT